MIGAMSALYVTGCSAVPVWVVDANEVSAITQTSPRTRLHRATSGRQIAGVRIALIERKSVRAIKTGSRHVEQGELNTDHIRVEFRKMNLKFFF